MCSTEDPTGSEPGKIALESSSKTKERERKSRERSEALLAAMMAHEAVHHAVREGIIDVYRGERLYQFFGGGGKIARELAPVALKNPDSIVAFAFRSLGADGSSDLLPGASELVSPKPSEEDEDLGELSGELEIGPLIGQQKIKLAVALAKEAIDKRLGAWRKPFASPEVKDRACRTMCWNSCGPRPKNRSLPDRRRKFTLG